jgi:hypothetical protein
LVFWGCERVFAASKAAFRGGGGGGSGDVSCLCRQLGSQSNRERA